MTRGNQHPPSSPSSPSSQQDQPKKQNKRISAHEFQCTSCQGILANFGQGDVKCFGIQSKPFLAKFERIPITNKRPPYIIIGSSTFASTTGPKKFSTQWGDPGSSWTVYFPLLFFRNWFTIVDKLTTFEEQKKLVPKIYKSLSHNVTLISKQFIPKFSDVCSTMYLAGVKVGNRMFGSNPKDKNSDSSSSSWK